MGKRFYGEFLSTLDDKGRVVLPAKLKEVLNSDKIWITKGMNNEQCLMIYKEEDWNDIVSDLEKKVNFYSKEGRWLFRSFLAPARDIEIDKNNRIAIPQNLREFANLKKDLIFLGIGKAIELWDVENYNNEYKKASESGENLFNELGRIKLYSFSDD